jgi:hypothetical protein
MGEGWGSKLWVRTGHTPDRFDHAKVCHRNMVRFPELIICKKMEFHRL